MFDGNIMTFATSNTERLRIGSAGQIGLGGANYGSSGQVLTSNGLWKCSYMADSFWWWRRWRCFREVNDLSDAKTDNSGEALGMGTGTLAADDGTNIAVAIVKMLLTTKLLAILTTLLTKKALSLLTTRLTVNNVRCLCRS